MRTNRSTCGWKPIRPTRRSLDTTHWNLAASFTLLQLHRRDAPAQGLSRLAAATETPASPRQLVGRDVGPPVARADQQVQAVKRDLVTVALAQIHRFKHQASSRRGSGAKSEPRRFRLCVAYTGQLSGSASSAQRNPKVAIQKCPPVPSEAKAQALRERHMRRRR
jgi:hypothetical protein